MAGESGRWEFRCWPGPEQAERLRALLQRDPPPRKAETRTDIYLLPPQAEAAGAEGGHLAKLRHGRDLEIKRWLRSAPPLEYWEMAHRAGFPLDAASRILLSEALGLRGGAALDGTAAAALAAALQAAGARTVAMEKTRLRRSLEGCEAELTEVACAGRRLWTAAVEAASPADAQHALAALDLAGLENVHYGRALQRLLADEEIRP